MLLAWVIQVKLCRLVHFGVVTSRMFTHPVISTRCRRVVRAETSTGSHVYVEDLSSNGTFINGELIGKGKKVALKNNDEISLSMKLLKGEHLILHHGNGCACRLVERISCVHFCLMCHVQVTSPRIILPLYMHARVQLLTPVPPPFAVFVFHDYTDNDSASYPEQLRSQYTMSRVLGAGACGEVRLAFRKVSAQSVHHLARAGGGRVRRGATRLQKGKCAVSTPCRACWGPARAERCDSPSER